MNIQLLISVGTFLIVIGGLVWRMSAIHQKTVSNEKAIERAHERINKLEDVQNNKITELTNHIQAIRENQIRMEEKINLIIKYEKKKEA